MILKAVFSIALFRQRASSQTNVRPLLEESLAADLRQMPPDHIRLSSPLNWLRDKLDFASFVPALYNRRLEMK